MNLAYQLLICGIAVAAFVAILFLLSNVFWQYFHFHKDEVRVGTGLIVIRDGKVLVGRRKGSHAAGLVSFPGGKLDFNETWEDCVLREKSEECGDKLQVKIRPFNENKVEFAVTNDIMPQYGNHYVTVFLVADWVKGEAENTEPEKCEGWDWITYDELASLSQHQDLANWVPMRFITEHREWLGI